MHRRGMTVLELIIALAIVAVVLTATIEAAAGMRRFAGLQRSEHILEVKGKRALDAIGADLSNSAWMPTPVSATTGAITNLTTFPRIWMANDPARSRARPPSYPYGDTLTFFRVRTARHLAGDPRGLRVENVDFEDFAQPPVAMSDYAKARPASSLILNNAWSFGQPLVHPVWESWHEIAGPTPGQNFVDNTRPANLRQFRYTVIPDRRSGLGVLLRQWRNGGSDVDTDWPAPRPDVDAERITDGVVAIHFTTYLTETDNSQVNLNQVVVALTLADLPEDGSVTVGVNGLGTGKGAAISRTFSGTIALRSITNPMQE